MSDPRLSQNEHFSCPDPKREAVSREQVIAWLKDANWDGKVMPIIQATLDLLARGEALQAPITEDAEAFIKDMARWANTHRRCGSLGTAETIEDEIIPFIRSQAQEIAGFHVTARERSADLETAIQRWGESQDKAEKLEAENATLRKQLEAK